LKPDSDALEILLQTSGQHFGKSVFDVEMIVPDIVWPPDEEPSLQEEFTPHEFKELARLLEGAIERSLQGYADKKIGLTLSGGVDSSLVLHLIKKAFPDIDIVAYHTDWKTPDRSELEYARIAADFVGVPIRVIDANPEAQAPYVEDALIANKSVDHNGTAAYMAFKAMADDSVSVAVNGLGLDELFAGYAIHRGYYNRKRLHRLPSSKFLMRSKYYREASTRWGSDKAWILALISPRYSKKYVKGTEIDFSEIYNDIKRKNLWQTIHYWVLDAMVHQYANSISTMAKPHDLDVIYPYMDHDLMRRCLSYSPLMKKNKAPIRRLMREQYKFPDAIPSRGEKWDKLGWGAHSLDYFASNEYMKALTPSKGLENDWFTPVGIKELRAINEKPSVRAIQMNLFLKIVEHS
jgi:asparagine synthetase B (glutamine-hydrolysing)